MKTKYKGVYWHEHSQSYKAVVNIKGEPRTLGYHKDAEKCFKKYHNTVSFKHSKKQIKQLIFDILYKRQILRKEKTQSDKEIDRYETKVGGYNLSVILKVGTNSDCYTISFVDQDMNRELFKYQLDTIYEKLKLR